VRAAGAARAAGHCGSGSAASASAVCGGLGSTPGDAKRLNS
jgi:hypothetical protein